MAIPAARQQEIKRPANANFREYAGESLVCATVPTSCLEVCDQGASRGRAGRRTRKFSLFKFFVLSAVIRASIGFDPRSMSLIWSL